MSEQVRAKHILVEHSHEADDILKKLDENILFEDLAKDFSKCPSGKNGGDLGEFGRGQMVPEFEKATFALEVGSVSGAVKTNFGFHIIKRVS
jgi:peptidyl-prolyl cis-trans isomerase C